MQTQTFSGKIGKKMEMLKCIGSDYLWFVHANTVSKITTFYLLMAVILWFYEGSFVRKSTHSLENL